MKSNFTRIKKVIRYLFVEKPSLFIFIFFFAYSFGNRHYWESNKLGLPGPFFDDAAEYYSYLPDYFYKSPAVLDTNFMHNKRTVGLAIMYSPSFLVGHIIAKSTGEKVDGYSVPYQISFRWSAVLFCLFGLWFCRKLMLRYFSEVVIALTLLCVFLGTNLLYYTYCEAGMPHVCLFFLVSVFLFSCLKWIADRNKYYLLSLFLVGGLITLIRPTDVLVFLFPLLFDLKNFKGFIERIRYFFAAPFILLFSVLLFLCPLLIQMLIWKFCTGHYIYYSYGTEHFYFSDPQIINVLFSFRKGWLLYTPMMGFAVLGIFIAFRKLKSFFPPLVVFFSAFIYVNSCWWDWAFGGSFSCRIIVDMYALLTIPFAVFLSSVFALKLKRKAIKTFLVSLTLVVMALFIQLNFIQTVQYKHCIIHWYNMSKEAYFYSFLKQSMTEQEWLKENKMFVEFSVLDMYAGDNRNP